MEILGRIARRLHCGTKKNAQRELLWFLCLLTCSARISNRIRGGDAGLIDLLVCVLVPVYQLVFAQTDQELWVFERFPHPSVQEYHFLLSSIQIDVHHMKNGIHVFRNPICVVCTSRMGWRWEVALFSNCVGFSAISVLISMLCRSFAFGIVHLR